MIEKVSKFMEVHGMLPENRNVVLGVSGGADSVSLLCLLVKLRERYSLNLTAVHVNHNIRKEAGEDAAYVESLCRRWQVPFILISEDVEGLAERQHLSCEEAGRQVRYRAFADTLCGMDEKSGGHGCIAVAHNREDRAETFLFHLLRGTGLDGMGSIRPVRENEDGSRVIRPLLDCTRKEIEAFLKKENVKWCIDRTNQEDIYTRNRIRNRILPYAEENVCVGASGHLAQEAELLARTADFVDRQTIEALDRCAKILPRKEGVLFSLEQFHKEDPFLQEHMIRKAMKLVGKQKDLTAAHVGQVKKLFLKECSSGRRVCLPVCEILATRQFDNVLIRNGVADGQFAGTGRRKMETAEVCRQEQAAETVVKEGIFAVPGLGTAEVRILDGPGKSAENASFFENIPEKKYTKWFDYDKIIESVVFRTRKTGDYLTISEKLEKKSLKRYLIEEKIPAESRNSLVLLADGAHILWVVGHRISAAYKVTAQTAAILEVTIRDND